MVSQLKDQKYHVVFASSHHYLQDTKDTKDMFYVCRLLFVHMDVCKETLKVKHCIRKNVREWENFGVWGQALLCPSKLTDT